jgi:hypothetical protein
VRAAIDRFVSHDAGCHTLPLPVMASIDGGARSGVMAPRSGGDEKDPAWMTVN